jgi:predicted  nucleic acid-binding Zn-ribbon protein
MAQKDRELEKFYKTIPAQQKRIQELEKELSSAQGHQANRGLSTKNTQLKQALQEAQQENTKLSQEAEALRGELNVKPSENIVYRADPEQQERIQELEKNLEDLNNALQAKAQEINQKEEENSSLRQDIYNTYQQLDNMLTETLR